MVSGPNAIPRLWPSLILGCAIASLFALGSFCMQRAYAADAAALPAEADEPLAIAGYFVVLLGGLIAVVWYAQSNRLDRALAFAAAAAAIAAFHSAAEGAPVWAWGVVLGISLVSAAAARAFRLRRD